MLLWIIDERMIWVRGLWYFDRKNSKQQQQQKE